MVCIYESSIPPFRQIPNHPQSPGSNKTASRTNLLLQNMSRSSSTVQALSFHNIAISLHARSCAPTIAIGPETPSSMNFLASPWLTEVHIATAVSFMYNKSSSGYVGVSRVCPLYTSNIPSNIHHIRPPPTIPPASLEYSPVSAAAVGNIVKYLVVGLNRSKV